MKTPNIRFFIAACCIVFLTAPAVHAQRIKDIAYFKGVQSEQLLGYGLVVGLAGTGDSYRSTFTMQSVASMMKRFGISVPDVNMRTRNIAAVMITATISNFNKAGSQFDINVSSMGDATSLMGGSLLMSPLAGKDGELYALAQGPLSIGGYDINTESGGRVIKNHALSGRIPLGAVLQRELPSTTMNTDVISIVLRQPDFTTAMNITNAVNTKLSDTLAMALDASEIMVKVPVTRQARLAAFLAELEGTEVKTDAIAKVVLNERTGTVVAGSMVRIQPVTISHGSLKINIKSNPVISQPGALSSGSTVLFNNLTPTVEKEDTSVYSINGASNVQEVAAALNSLKVSPRDIIAIFQALKEAGALTAELVIM